MKVWDDPGRMSIQDAQLTARSVAGYRVLRSLARDADAQVLVGFPVADGGEEPGVEGRGVEGPGVEGPTTVALKTTGATAERWNVTFPVLEALQRARGPHAIRVLDIDAADDLICVIFERLTNGSLAELLTARERFDAGEVVTIVAPLAETLSRMHATGVAHRAVGPRSVMFSSEGAPVLIGFGSSSIFAPGSPEVVLERQPGVTADRAAIRELAGLLLARVGGSRARAARGLGDELASCPEELVLEVLGRRLFDMAAAMPVRFSDDERVGEPEDERDSTRVVPVGAPVPDQTETSGGASALLARLIPDALAQRVVDAVAGSPLASLAPIAATAARVWRSWSPARRRVVLGVVVVTVVVTGALAVVPTSSAARADAATGPSPRAASSDRPTAASSGENARTLAGDDPLAAAAVLVADRERCLRSLSLLCLDGVDQPDGGAYRDDQAAIRTAQQGGELPDPLVRDGSALAPELVERLGDSALVRLGVESSGPASLLLVAGDAGWRIRDVISAPTTESPAPSQGSN